jgi:phosphoribosylformimino-5-aminoimidazole carboxamide ribotide isomerase
VLKRYHAENGDASFDILPAIDLRGGRVVRLVEGDYSRETSYSDDPVAVAVEFAAAGATWIHIVDLDAARGGEPSQTAIISAIAQAVGKQVRCQVGGGIRALPAAEALIEAGAARIVVGTAALRDPAFAGALVERHGADRVVAAIDVRADQAVGEGWDPSAAGVDPFVAVSRLAEVGVTRFAVTAIDRDGRLQGPDLDLLRSVVEMDRGAVVASGGVSSLDDIRAVRNIGCHGAIVGRALYEGTIDLRKAIYQRRPQSGD